MTGHPIADLGREPHLGQSQQSKLQPVSSTEPTELLRIPLQACQPCHCCIRNVDLAAIIYIKSAANNRVAANDYGIVLGPGEWYDWGGSIPRDASITALSTVNGSLVAIEANWCVVNEVF